MLYTGMVYASVVLICTYSGVREVDFITELACCRHPRQLRSATNALYKHEQCVCENSALFRSDTLVNAQSKLHLIFHFVPLREKLTKKCYSNTGYAQRISEFLC